MELGDRLAKRFAGVKGLFITLTYDRAPYSSPLECFRRQSDERHVRRFIERLGAAVGASLTSRWIRKLEFHESGWPHWHLCIDWPSRIPREVVAQCWGHGFVNVKRVTPERCFYFAKYIAKGGTVPGWVYMLRIRECKVIATSPGFWPDRLPVDRGDVPRRPPRSPYPYVSLGERLRSWTYARTVVQSEMRSDGGRIFRTFNVPMHRARALCMQYSMEWGRPPLAGFHKGWHQLNMTFGEVCAVLLREEAESASPDRERAQRADGPGDAALNLTTETNPPEHGGRMGPPLWWADFAESMGAAEWELAA
jgi:hypothetical protein